MILEKRPQTVCVGSAAAAVAAVDAAVSIRLR
jgi:hypothetical protein